jgi:hypothetical protein
MALTWSVVRVVSSATVRMAASPSGRAGADDEGDGVEVVVAWVNVVECLLGLAEMRGMGEVLGDLGAHEVDDEDARRRRDALGLPSSRLPLRALDRSPEDAGGRVPAESGVSDRPLS